MLPQRFLILSSTFWQKQLKNTSTIRFFPGLSVPPLEAPSARWSQKLFAACCRGCGTAKKCVDDVAPSSMTIS